jgi:hypothetical protein
MPQAPAAMSRRFMAGETGTAPYSFSLCRSSVRFFASRAFSAAGNVTNECLTRVFFLVGFEVVDRMVECLVKGEFAEPELFPEISVGSKQILMGDAVGRVEAGKNAISVGSASHGPDDERDDVALNRDEIHGDVAGVAEPPTPVQEPIRLNAEVAEDAEGSI